MVRRGRRKAKSDREKGDREPSRRINEVSIADFISATIEKTVVKHRRRKTALLETHAAHVN